MLSKSGLAIMLSKLKTFESPKVGAEQYATPSEIAADCLWQAFMSGDIKTRRIADFGCGPGIFGAGCLMLGAMEVYFVDSDPKALAQARENLSFLESHSLLGKNYRIIQQDISQFDKTVDVVIQNPPFGTKKEHADRDFLEKAFQLANVVYSFHKSSTADFVRKFSLESKFACVRLSDYRFPIKKAFDFQKKPSKDIEVSLFRMERQS